MKIGTIVQLNQGDTESRWLIVSLKNDVAEVVHEDELDCKPSLAPIGIFHEAEIGNRDRNLILSAFAETKRGRELIRSLM